MSRNRNKSSMIVGQNSEKICVKEKELEWKRKVLWKLGVATPKEVVPTSYCVETDDSGEYRRNRSVTYR